MCSNSNFNETNSSAQKGVKNKYLQGNQYVYHYNRQLDRLNSQNQLLKQLLQANECMDKAVQSICCKFFDLENKLAQISCEQLEDKEKIRKELEVVDTRLANKLAEHEMTHSDIHRVVKELTTISQKHIIEMNQYKSSILDLSNQFHSYDHQRQQIENKQYKYDKMIETVFDSLDELKETQQSYIQSNNKKLDDIVDEIKDEVTEQFETHDTRHHQIETQHRDYEKIIEEVLISLADLKVNQQNPHQLTNEKFDDMVDDLKVDVSKQENAIYSLVQQLQYLKDFETGITSYMDETSNNIEKIELQLMKMDKNSKPLCNILKKLPPNYPVNTIYINGDFISISHFISIDCEENIAIFGLDDQLINIDCRKIDGISFRSHL